MRWDNKWDARFLHLAQNEVATWSKDPDERVGCVLVSPDMRQFSCGYNGLPQGLADTEERLGDHDLKNKLSVHAELNAILNSRVDLTEWRLYVTKAPCVECAKAIIQAGIWRIIHPPIDPDSRWSGDQHAAAGLLSEASVHRTVLRED